MADNVALVQDAYDGFARGDVGPLLSILGDNIEWYEAEHVTYWPGGAFKGPQAVLNLAADDVERAEEGEPVGVEVCGVGGLDDEGSDGVVGDEQAPDLL